MKVTIRNYQEMAGRTMPNLTDKAADGAHMAMGITTEIEELRDAVRNNDKKNIREEHGDVNWYIANECRIYALDFESIMNEARGEFNPFSLHDYVDLHKRELAYGKEMDVEALKNQLVALVQFLQSVAVIHRFDYESSLQVNIDKLYKRYPEKFTQEKALNRDLKKESEVL